MLLPRLCAFSLLRVVYDRFLEADIRGSLSELAVLGSAGLIKVLSKPAKSAYALPPNTTVRLGDHCTV